MKLSKKTITANHQPFPIRNPFWDQSERLTPYKLGSAWASLSHKCFTKMFTVILMYCTYSCNVLHNHTNSMTGTCLPVHNLPSRLSSADESGNRRAAVLPTVA